jgi:antitoxin MazE
MEADMAKSATLTIQRWGNSLAVRIPSGVAKSARLVVGQPVEVAVQERRLSIVPVGSPELTLTERLQAFDPARHGGEVMVSRRVGVEAM